MFHRVRVAQRTVGQQRAETLDSLAFCAPLGGTPLFVLPAELLAVTPELHKSGTTIPTVHCWSSPCCDNSELQFRLFVDMASSEGLVGMKADDTSSAWLAQRSCSA